MDARKMKLSLQIIMGSVLSPPRPEHDGMATGMSIKKEDHGKLGTSDKLKLSKVPSP